MVELYLFIDEMVSRSGGRSYFWAAMTHLTPSPLDFLFNAQNFRSLNNQIARKVYSHKIVVCNAGNYLDFFGQFWEYLKVSKYFRTLE